MELHQASSSVDISFSLRKIEVVFPSASVSSFDKASFQRPALTLLHYTFISIMFVFILIFATLTLDIIF